MNPGPEIVRKLEELNHEIRFEFATGTPESFERVRTLLNQAVLILSQLSDEYKKNGGGAPEKIDLMLKGCRASLEELPKLHELFEEL